MNKSDEDFSRTSTCCTCGYSWRTGKDGSHSCTKSLLKRIKTLEDAIREHKDTKEELCLDIFYDKTLYKVLGEDV